MIKKVSTIFLCLISCVYVGVAYSDVVSVELDRKVAFKINGEPFAYQTVAFLEGEAKKHNAQLSSEKLVRGLIENRLFIASQSIDHKEKSDDHHAEHDHEGHDHEEHSEEMHQIGINVQSTIEYRQLLSSIYSLPADVALTPFISKLLTSPNSTLQGMLLEKENKAMQNEGLTEAQVDAAKALKVIEYRIGGKDGVISFWDVYSTSNIHDRTRLRRADANTLKLKALAYLRTLYHESEIVSNTAWDQAAIENLKLFVFDKVKKQAYFKSSGILADLHHDTPALNPFKKMITSKDIEGYYQAHKNEFVQVASVKARHIVTDSQAKADKIYSEIKAGLSFENAVKKYSIANDKDLDTPGSMGLIDKNSKGLSFNQKLALIQPEGKVSTPYRMLDGKTFEIFLVDDKSPEYLPLSDKSVKREILNKLAREKAASHFNETLENLVRGADIKINKLYYGDSKW